MFTMNEDLSIYATRGDVVFFSVTADDNGILYKFQPGDIVRMAIYGKKEAESCVMQKDFPVTEVTEKVFIYLDEEDTKIGEIISKHKDYWYEIVLNPDTLPQTIIGYDEDGAKVFRLFPESEEIHDEPVVEPEDIPVVDSELDMTSHRPIENQAVARAITTILDVCERTNAAVAENFVTPQMFGAIADGKADDTEAIQMALETGRPLHLPKGNYYCPGDLVLPSGAYVVGNHATLKDCVLCVNREASVRDIQIGGSGYVAISTEKAGQSLLSVSLSGIRINTSAESAILFECGGEASRYIYNVNIDDVRIDGAVKYGIRFKNNYNNNSKTPWMTCINISNVFMDQFSTAILMDYEAPADYSFDTNRPIATNSLMSFKNVRGQWISRSEHFVDCQLSMSNVHFVDSFPVDYKGADGKRMFNFVSRRFKTTDLYVTNVSISGAIVWIPTLFNEVEIENTTNKAYDFTEMFSTVTDVFSPSRLMIENPYIETTHLRNNAAVVRPIPTDDWKEQNIAKAHGVGFKMLASNAHGGDAPIIGGNILGYPIVSTEKGTYLVLSGRYMPVFYSGNLNYKLPSSPCVGYMVFNDVSKKPMWWTGSKWVYADGSAVGSSELT